MVRSCPGGQHWDSLVKTCIHCKKVCHRETIIPKCSTYCMSAQCKAMSGHYYDALLKTCVRCTDVCGRHPAGCLQHCQTLSTSATSHIPTLEGITSPTAPTALIDSAILYSLLALCMLLLLSVLSLALAVLVRGDKSRSPKSAPKAPKQTQKVMIESGQDAVQQGGQEEPRSRDSVTNTSHPTYAEPSDDSIPTETCVCIHCFPDLTPRGHASDAPHTPPFSYYQQAVLQHAQEACPLWNKESIS